MAEIKKFFDEMFFALAIILLQDPENGLCKELFLHEYLKRYRAVYTKKEDQTQEEFDGQICALDREIKSTRKDNKRKYDLICLFFDLIKEEMHSTQEIGSLIDITEEFPEIVYYKGADDHAK